MTMQPKHHFRLQTSHKAIVNLIPLLVLGLVVVGLGAYVFLNSAQAKSGLSEDEVNALIEKEKTIQKEATKEPSVICGTGTILQGNQCVIVKNPDTPRCMLPEGCTTLPPSPIVQPSASREPCRQPTGEFTRLYFRQRNLLTQKLLVGGIMGDVRLTKPEVLGVFKYTGNCPADIYIEAGINSQPQSGSPLAIRPTGFGGAILGTPSSCDGNVHYNGVIFKQLVPNQVVIFELQPDNYGAVGTYWLDVGAYTGCLKDGGKTLTYKRGLVGFTNAYEVGTGSLNNDIHMSWVQLAP